MDLLGRRDFWLGALAGVIAWHFLGGMVASKLPKIGGGKGQ